MNNTNINNLLSQIKDLYGLVMQNSISLISNFSDEALPQFIAVRDKLLKDIQLKEAEYGRIKNDQIKIQENCWELKKEIRELIMSITTIDDRITDKIKNCMNNIKNELKGLYSTSKAAIAYSSQRRR